jgi:hypothetical protein
MTRLNLTGTVAAVLCAATFSACGADGGDEPTDRVLVRMSAATDDAGSCRPESSIVAHTESSGLYAIRGDASYVMPAGTTNIPYQAVFRSTDDRGYSDSDAITVLNHAGPCSDLVINIEIQKCEYLGEDKRDKSDCPDFDFTGTDGFSAVNVTRADRA